MLFTLNSTSSDTEIASLLFSWNAIFIPVFSTLLCAFVYVTPLKLHIAGYFLSVSLRVPVS